MRRQLASATSLFAFFWLIAPAICTAQTLPKTAPAATVATAAAGGNDRAASLADQALAAEAEGKLAERDALLAQAIEAAPYYARAHWAAREVRRGGKWLPVAQAEQAAADDPRRAQYEKARCKQPSNAEGEQALAIWCDQHRMEQESKWHWLQVLRYDPENKRALKELDLHPYNGELLTTAEHNAAMHDAKKFEQISKRWKPQLVRWRQDLAGQDEDRRDSAISQIRQITDPDVAPAFELVLWTEAPENENATFSTEVVRAISKLNDPNVVSALARQAVLSPWESTRRAAIEGLASRELFAYVPVVMSWTGLPIERTSEIHVDDDGNVYYEQEWQDNGPLALDIHVDRVAYTLLHLKARGSSSFNGSVPLPVAIAMDHKKAMKQARARDESHRQTVEQWNRDLPSQNSNAIALLRANAAVDCGDAIEDWWDWWRDYNELDARKQAPQYIYTNRHHEVAVPCCFGKGTKVSTLTGLVPIEKIRLGDRVLSLNPQTGELGYKLVLSKSVRPPSPVRNLTIGDEVILTTRGHRFWQIGRGWQMSKQLETGVLLFTCAAPATIDSIADAGNEEAFNLVVEDFHTYFVGEHRLLVHDNRAPLPVLGPVPGLQQTGRQLR